MKKLLLRPTVWLLTMTVTAVALCFTACDGDDDPQVAPTITTATPTAVTPSTATAGGDITSNGGATILAAGICYSATTATPTVADDTTKTPVLTGKFTSKLKDLASGSTYRVRAYATNSAGTGYGAVMTFTTGNEAPTATNVVINGEIKGDVEVTVTYGYQDKEGDAQMGTTIQWYRANDATGAGKIAIEDATTDKYRISDEDHGKFIWVGVTPKAAAGTLAGVEVNSEKKGPVGEATTVTFMYNGEEVTYGIWNSTKTSRRWLDRNLGAASTPSAYNDYANYGDLFQWGRLADGHQLIIRTPNVGDPLTGASAPKNSDVTNTKATSPTPVDSKFISPAALPIDWIDPQNNNLWQVSTAINNPCPVGWHIPTFDEWTAEGLTSDPVANYNQLKFTHTGYRSEDASLNSVDKGCYYWTSTPAVIGTGAISVSQVLTDDPEIFGRSRARGLACRCIKNEDQ